jgi:predicted dehydrogenase
MKSLKKSLRVTGGGSRRQFLSTALTLGGLTILPRHALGGPGFIAPSDRLNVAMIGAGGQGMQNLKNLLQEDDVQVVALADVAEWADYSRSWHVVPGGRKPGLDCIQEHYASKETAKEHPRCGVYVDFRRMLEEERHIDAVVVSTPDHTHAVAAMAVIQSRKHLYLEKPLARTILEVRRLTEAAREAGIVTQMGQQGHAGEGIRLTYEWIRDGAIGPVREVTAWNGDPNTAACETDGTPAGPPPEGLDWNLWLGPAESRPYHPRYTPRGWRQYWDFGTGKIGDMGCHNMDPAFFALDLGYPEWVQARSAWGDRQRRPFSAIIQYQFPARGAMPPVKMTWYEGLLPPRPDDLEPGRDLEGRGNGILFTGDKGRIMCAGWAGTPRIIPESKMRQYRLPPKTLARTRGIYRDWIDACKTGGRACSDFSYSGPMTEVILMGVVAMRTEEKLYWDGPNMKATNFPGAQEYVVPRYHNGWTL